MQQSGGRFSLLTAYVSRKRILWGRVPHQEGGAFPRSSALNFHGGMKKSEGSRSLPAGQAGFRKDAAHQGVLDKTAINISKLGKKCWIKVIAVNLSDEICNGPGIVVWIFRDDRCFVEFFL